MELEVKGEAQRYGYRVTSCTSKGLPSELLFLLHLGCLPQHRASLVAPQPAVMCMLCILHTLLKSVLPAGSLLLELAAMQPHLEVFRMRVGKLAWWDLTENLQGCV